jgi:hypothetical protein
MTVSSMRYHFGSWSNGKPTLYSIDDEIGGPSGASKTNGPCRVIEILAGDFFGVGRSTLRDG